MGGLCPRYEFERPLPAGALDSLHPAVACNINGCGRLEMRLGHMTVGPMRDVDPEC